MHTPYQFERLEDRLLLAVSVTQSSQGILKIIGDSADNEIRIDGTGTPGQMEVFVQGVSAGVFSGVTAIQAKLRVGNDSLFLSAVDIDGDVNANLGDGGDLLSIDTDPDLGAGPAADVSIGGSVIGFFGNDAGDAASFETNVGGVGLGISIGGSVSLQGITAVALDGNGTDFNVQPDDISIGGFLKITGTGTGGSLIAMDDVNVGGLTEVNLGIGVDAFFVTDCRFTGRVEMVLGSGDDLLDLDGGAGEQNRFGAAVSLHGGGGTDTLDQSAANVFAVTPVLKKFETLV